jgi:hypothetical protein
MEYIQTAKLLQRDLVDAIEHDELVKFGDRYDEMETLYKTVAHAAQEIRLIIRGSHQLISNRLKKIRADIEILEKPSADAVDIAELELNDRSVREVAPGISMRTISVPSEEFIPDAFLYYIRNTDEYGIKIQGCVIKGVIRDIAATRRAVPCPRRECADSKCTWGHVGTIAFSPSNFLYTREPLQQKNLHMRHVGSRDTLRFDIANATRAELAARNAQTMHDLLVQLAIWETQS